MIGVTFWQCRPMDTDNISALVTWLMKKSHHSKSVIASDVMPSPLLLVFVALLAGAFDDIQISAGADEAFLLLFGILCRRLICTALASAVNEEISRGSARASSAGTHALAASWLSSSALRIIYQQML